MNQPHNGIVGIRTDPRQHRTNHDDPHIETQYIIDNLCNCKNKVADNEHFKITPFIYCNYFCFNIKVTICNDCEHINKKTEYHCVKCDSRNVDHATRVIGYLKRITSFSKDRQKEAAKRYYSQK